jgi:hypothetical protein
MKAVYAEIVLCPTLVPSVEFLVLRLAEQGITLPPGPVRVERYGDSADLVRELTALIGSGRKRAGTGLLWAYEYDGETVAKAEGLLRLFCNRPIIAFSSYVQDGVVIDKGDAPGPMMRFDYGQKSWVQDEALAWWMVRQVRDEKLRSSDWTDTMSAIDRLGVERFNAWQLYRQALRDVPLQGDPYGVVWPVQPGGATLST